LEEQAEVAGANRQHAGDVAGLEHLGEDAGGEHEVVGAMEIEGGRIEIAGGVEENARGGRALAGEGGVEGFAVEIGEVDFGEVALESGQVEVVAVAGTEDADAAAGSGGGGGNQLVNAAAVRGAAFPGVAGLAVGSDVAFGDLGMVSPGCGLSVSWVCRRRRHWRHGARW
jgi:hypothetical protein